MFDHTRDIKLLKHFAFVSSAAALVATAGAVAAEASSTQPVNDGERNRNYRFQQIEQDQILHFALADDLLDHEIRNNIGEEVAELEDLIIDRGSGRIVFAVLETDDFWGMGGDEFAIKYEELRYMVPSQSFVLDLREETVEQFAEALPDDWDEMENTDWMDGIEGWFTDEDERERREWEDRIHEAAASGDRSRKQMEGTVTDITRDTYGGEDHVVLTIRGEDGNETDVVLAPSWHFGDLEPAVERNAEVAVNAVRYGNRWVVMDFEMGGENYTMRDSAGAATWDEDLYFGGRYVLASTLEGMDIELTGDDFGEVEDVVIEAPSGHVAFLGIDPDTNLLGIGDQTSLVPWSAFSVRDEDEIALRANEEQVTRTLTMPDDLSKWTSPAAVAQVYNAFDENMPSFKPRDKQRSGSPYSESMRRDLGLTEGEKADRTPALWGLNSEMLEALRTGESMEISGTYRGSRVVSLARQTRPAHMIVVDTPDGRKNIILGPAWFIEDDDLALQPGDEISVVGKRAKFKGRTIAAAWSIEQGEDRWEFWDGEDANWLTD